METNDLEAMTEQERQIEYLQKYLSDFDNLSETGFFSSAFIDDSVFYHKGLTLFQFLQVGREFIREYSMLSELRKPSENLVRSIVDVMEGYEALIISEQGNQFAIQRDAILPISEEIANLAPFNQNDKTEMVKFAIWYRIVGYKSLWDINGDYDKLYGQFKQHENNSIS